MSTPPPSSGLVISPSSVSPGNHFYITSTGWDPGEVIDYSWPNIKYTEPVQADNTGKLVLDVLVDPGRAIQTYQITLVGRIHLRTLTGFVNVVAPIVPGNPINIPPTPPPQQVTDYSAQFIAPDGTIKNGVISAIEINNITANTVQVNNLTVTTSPATETGASINAWVSAHSGQPTTPTPPPATIPPTVSPPTPQPPPSNSSVNLGDWGILNPIRDIESNIVNLIDTAITDGEQLLKDAFSVVHGLFPKDQAVVIESSLDNAILVSGSALVAGFGIYTATTATDLLHPIKGTGLVPMGIDIVNKLGIGVITGTIIGAAALAYLGTPLKYYWNSIFRPYRPNVEQADRLFFKETITDDTWAQLMKYQGWPDNFIDNWRIARYSDVSPRLLIKMFDNPNLDKDWVNHVLIHSGLDPVDIKNILDFADFAATEKQKGSSQSISLSRYKKGYIDAPTLDAELGLTNLKDSAISKIKIIADLERDEAQRDLLLKANDEGYLAGALSEADMINSTNLYIADPSEAGSHIAYMRYKFMLSNKAPKPPKQPVGSASVAIDRFVAGVTTQSQLQQELASLNRSPDEITLDVQEATLKKSLEDYKQAAKPSKEKKVEILKGKETIAVSRFTAGYITLSEMQTELQLLNKTADEITLITTEAQLQQDTEFRKERVAELRASYQKATTSRDDFITQLSTVISDQPTIDHIVMIEDLKKIGSPKKTPANVL